MGMIYDVARPIPPSGVRCDVIDASVAVKRQEAACDLLLAAWEAPSVLLEVASYLSGAGPKQCSLC